MSAWESLPLKMLPTNRELPTVFGPQHIWTHLSRLRFQVKWSGLLTCARYRYPLPSKMLQVCWQQEMIKANAPRLETIAVLPVPFQASHTLFAKHQLHMLLLLCLKWTNANNSTLSCLIGSNDNTRRDSMCVFLVFCMHLTGDSEEWRFFLDLEFLIVFSLHLWSEGILFRCYVKVWWILGFWTDINTLVK